MLKGSDKGAMRVHLVSEFISPEMCTLSFFSGIILSQKCSHKNNKGSFKGTTRVPETLPLESSRKIQDNKPGPKQHNSLRV